MDKIKEFYNICIKRAVLVSQNFIGIFGSYENELLTKKYIKIDNIQNNFIKRKIKIKGRNTRKYSIYIIF